MTSVAILNHPQVALFELGCATELFALDRPEFTAWYHARVVSLSPSESELIGGARLSSPSVKDLSEFTTLVIPSWPVDQTRIAADMADTILTFAQRGGRLVSFCSGAFLLGYLGLLDGRKATTHWQYEAKFRQAFPRCDYQANVLYVLDDDLGCSAGSAAALDLGLAIIRADYGAETANKVARRLVLSGHRKGGQAQFVDTPMPVPTKQLCGVMDWALAHLAERISIDQMAERACLSRRSFDRVFRQQTGQSPQAWLVSQRVTHACRLLERPGFTIEQVATHSGFTSAGNLRHQFKQQLGVSPRQYRDNFACE